ncbi:mannitol dehydrogenase family protein [Pararhodobacter oceanensis]|uniref:Mannitol dehydrogenase n=1 Tax=Pararhodobacter oceanensis TaxID=2172121 RepID=A0A2T8HVZ8_9RHOB|nr:mannitol dehydrogenase [Pararhodobacter oceanensis]
MNTPLLQANLGMLRTLVAPPRYDRAALKPGILHIGLGNFHRAHQAVYLNALMNAGGDPAWGIIGAGVRDPDTATRDLLMQQDCLYSVVEVDFDRAAASVIGVMTGFVPVEPQGNAALIHAMTDPETRIVSLTVTEGGYFLDGNGDLNTDHPTLLHDIAAPQAPNSAFGAIIAALAARRAQGIKPFTVMSCDNLPGNGDIARAVITGLAQRINPDLAAWINEHVTFPNGMVDRITPATGDRERALVAERFGLADLAPVICEPFKQWVLEDSFTDGRPALEEVGVTFTHDIASFEKMKLRILNGGHAIMAYAGAMLGFTYSHDAVTDPLIHAYLRKTLETDVLPFVAPVPGFTPQEYLETILGRFANPGVADTISRLSYDGSNRQPKFIVGSIAENLQAGRPPAGLALSSALWCRYCLGRDEHGGTIAPNDPNWDQLHATAQRAQSEPEVWLDQEPVYGAVGRDPVFREAFATALRRLQEHGTASTLQDHVEGNA